MAKDVVLRDGTPAMMWPMPPTDAAGLQENWNDLSAESRYNRVLSSVRTLSPQMLHRLVDHVDGREHIALVLFVFPERQQEDAAGVGRLIRYREDPAAADVAVTVDEQWRGRGVASTLLAELMQRRPHGVHEILTHVASGNAASLALLHRLGETEVAPDGPGALRVRVRLSSS